jgi:hypothetical protein
MHSSSRRLVLRPLLLLAAPLLLTAAGAEPVLAQGDPGERLAISVTVKPRASTPGASVTVSGKSLALGENSTVHIAFVEKSDVSKNVMAVANIDANGAYSGTARVLEPGLYTVTATAPDGKGIDSTTFSAIAPGALSSEMTGNLDNLVMQGMSPLVARIREEIDALPANPAKGDAEAKLDAVQAKIKAWPAQSQQLRDQISRYQSMSTKAPAAASLYQPGLEKLAEASAEVPAEKARVDAELARSKAAGVTCEKIEQVIESLKVVSAAANFLQSEVKSVATAFGLDLSAESFASAMTPQSLKGNSEYSLVVTDGFKFMANIAISATSFPLALAGLVTDAAIYVQQKNFEKFCEKMEGPVSATMHAEFFQEKAPWWTYDMTLQGKLILRYAKDAPPGSAVHMTGEIVGSATKLGAWEDALAVLYPVTKKTSTMLRKLIVPPGLPYVETDGKMAAASSPMAFFIPVEGDMVGTNLTLTLGEARSDMSDAVKAQVTYVLIGPMILAPVIVKYDLPFVKARFLLNRAMSESPLVLPVEVGRGAMRIERSVSRTRPGQGNSADYTLQIKACNPGC